MKIVGIYNKEEMKHALEWIITNVDAKNKNIPALGVLQINVR